MEMRTDRLCLRPYTPYMVSDRHVAWLNDPEVTRFSEQRHRVHSLNTVAAYVASCDQVTALLWAIYFYSEHVGNISAHRDMANGVADVGIMIGARGHWGKGIGREAWCLVLDWLLANGCRKVEAGTMVTNVGMLRIFEASGMTIEGVRQAHFLLDGKPVGMVMAGRLAP